MTEFTVKFADVAIHISANYQITADKCRDYYTDDPAELDITVTSQDIDSEMAIADKLPEEKRIKGPHKPEYMEWLALYRKLCSVLTSKSIVLMHGSAIGVDGKAHLFCAPSGTGKSTHTRLWREYFGDNAVMINDDKPLIRTFSDGKVLIYGTPWNGKHNLGSNISMPLCNVCFLQRGEKNIIGAYPASDVIPALMKYTFRPESADELLMTLDTARKISENCRFWSLKCNMDPEAAKISYEGMS